MSSKKLRGNKVTRCNKVTRYKKLNGSLLVTDLRRGKRERGDTCYKAESWGNGVGVRGSVLCVEEPTRETRRPGGSVMSQDKERL